MEDWSFDRTVASKYFYILKLHLNKMNRQRINDWSDMTDVHTHIIVNTDVAYPDLVDNIVN